MTQPVTSKLLRKVTLTIYGESPTWESLSDKLSYYAYGNEVCPTTGRPHLQGFAYAKNVMRFSAWKKLFPGAHIEEMKGNFRQNTTYCSKEGSYQHFGEKPMENGRKRTVLQYKERIDNGERVLDIAEDDEMFPTYVQYRQGLHEYKRHKREKEVQNDRSMPDVYLRFGAAGTGKTKWMDEQFGYDGWIQAPDNTGHWFNGCDRDVILFDDVEAGQVPPLSQFKRLCDRYPLQVSTKGGYIVWKPRVIVFTSNQHWNSWWKDITPADFEAIKRRFKRVTYIRDDGSEEVQWERESI